MTVDLVQCLLLLHYYCWMMCVQQLLHHLHCRCRCCCRSLSIFVYCDNVSLASLLLPNTAEAEVIVYAYIQLCTLKIASGHSSGNKMNNWVFILCFGCSVPKSEFPVPALFPPPPARQNPRIRKRDHTTSTYYIK